MSAAEDGCWDASLSLRSAHRQGRLSCVRIALHLKRDKTIELRLALGVPSVLTATRVARARWSNLLTHSVSSLEIVAVW